MVEVNEGSPTTRRIDVSRLSPAELAIRNAMLAVEDVGADPLLTDAVNLLQQARDKVADYVDRKLAGGAIYKPRARALVFDTEDIAVNKDEIMVKELIDRIQTRTAMIVDAGIDKAYKLGRADAIGDCFSAVQAEQLHENLDNEGDIGYMRGIRNALAAIAALEQLKREGSESK